MENDDNETYNVLDNLALEWTQNHEPAVPSDGIRKPERYVLMCSA
jgi:hypothetical protein